MSQISVEERPKVSGNIAFAIIVGIGLLVTFAQDRFSLREILVLVGITTVYLLIGTLAWDQVLASQSRTVHTVYMLGQIGLATGLFIASKGGGWLLPIPLVSQAIVLFRFRLGLAFTGLIMLAMIVPFVLLVGWEAVFTFGMGILAAFVFTVLFTQLAVSESEAREQMAAMAEDLAMANQQLREYSARVEELAVAQERNRLAREIHDGLGHYLTAVNMQLKAAQAVMEQDPEKAFRSIGQAQKLTEEALADVRGSVAALRNPSLEQRSVVETIEALIGDVRASGLQAELEVLGTPRQVAPQIALTVLRVVQEGLTNVRKHSGADKVLARLDFQDPERLRLEVRDEGRGAMQAGDGFGLVGLRERAQLQGGTMRVETGPGEGFQLFVELPA